MLPPPRAFWVCSRVLFRPAGQAGVFPPFMASAEGGEGGGASVQRGPESVKWRFCKVHKVLRLRGGVPRICLGGAQPSRFGLFASVGFSKQKASTGPFPNFSAAAEMKLTAVSPCTPGAAFLSFFLRARIWRDCLAAAVQKETGRP